MAHDVVQVDIQDLMLSALRVVAVRVDENFIVRQVSGDAIKVPLGGDIRETMPALYGAEEILAEADTDFSMPYIQLAKGHEQPVTLTASRDDNDALWLFLRDVREESLLQQKLVQNHNSLSLAQAQLLQARDAAQNSERAKTAFLANVSHELRTPLHVIIGGASILQKERAAPLTATDIMDYATDIHESGIFLLQLVDDLIDLSRAETGDLTLYEEWEDVGQIARGVVGLCNDLPEADGVKIMCDVDPQGPLLFVDARRIKQILLNLITNAMKAVAGRSDAQVIISVVSQGGRYSLVVEDNGPGMSADELIIARQPFGQPKASVRAQGTGLGLAIVDNLARLHGGILDIQTEPGRGLKAIVTLGEETVRPSR